MDAVLLVARLVLAGVFAVAGAAKLADLAGTRRAVAEFGMRGPLAGPLALALPIVELAIATALLPQRTAWSAAFAALVLLLVFLGAILFNLAQGRKPDCRCFGRLRAVPIGRSTVFLNLALLAMAGLCIWSGNGGPSAVAWIGGLTGFERAAVAGGAVALIGIGALALLQWQMLQQQRTVLARLDAMESRLAGLSSGTPAKSGGEPGLPVGSKAPAFSLPALGGGMVALNDLLTPGKPVLLVFTDPDCAQCKIMLPDLARWQRERPLTIAVLSAGTAAENRALGALGLQHVLLQQKYEIADVYACEGMPGAVMIRPDGTIGSAVAGGSAEIAQLVGSILGAPAQPPRIASTIFLRSRGG